MERELLPVLRSNGIAFVAYNPLAGGMLTGKHSREDGEVPKGRFHKNKNYSDRFYKPDVFDAVDKINAACNESDMSIVQASTFKMSLCNVLKATCSIPSSRLRTAG